MTLSRIVTAAALACATSQALATACSVSVSLMAFGLYDTTSASNNDTAATVEVTCIPGVSDPLTTPYTVTLAGIGSGNDSVRSVVAGAWRLYYQVYKDSQRTQVWGNGGSSGAGVSSTVTSSAALTPGLRVHTAYARMPAYQAVRPGVYVGSLLVTVDY